MPQAAEQHGEEQVAIGLQRGAAIAPQADVQVVAQPGGQADMPAPPEFGDRLADIGLVEVLHEAEAHHQAQTNGHAAVAGEIEVQLRGVGDGSQPGLAGGRVGQPEAVVDHRRQTIGDEHLLDEALHEARSAFGELVETVGTLDELVGQVLVAQYRPGDQLREQGNEGGEVDRMASRLDIAAVDIDQVAERLEDVEGDADRQQHRGQHERLEAHRLQRGIDVGHAEVGIFEVAQHTEVADHSEQ